MIGFPFELILEHVVRPQDDATLGERRVYLDPEAAPINVEAQEIDARALTTRPTGVAEIGGTIELRHTILIGLDVQHGDANESLRLRDLILLDLILRLVAAADLIGERDEATRQEISGLSWAIDYRPAGGGDTNESATITVTIDSLLDG